MLVKYKFVLCCLQETYPQTPPVWFSDTEEPAITNIVQMLTNTSGKDNHILAQVNKRFFFYFM